MELKFKNITKFSKEMYNQFLNFHNVRYGKRERNKDIFLIIVMMYMLIVNIKFNNYKIAGAIIVLEILYFVIKNYKQKNIIKNDLKSSKIKNEEEIIYYFYDKYFKTELSDKTEKIKYRKIYRIYQDDTFFYFYLDKNQAFVINKAGFRQGTAEEFKKFIFEKCKYKIKKNKQDIQ